MIYICSFEITHWNHPGPISRNGLKNLISGKDALFCLLTDKIDSEVLENAKDLKAIGMDLSKLKLNHLVFVKTYEGKT